MSLFFSNVQSKIEAHIYIGKQMNTCILHITYFFKYKINVEACNIYKENKQITFCNTDNVLFPIYMSLYFSLICRKMKLIYTV